MHDSLKSDTCLAGRAPVVSMYLHLGQSALAFCHIAHSVQSHCMHAILYWWSALPRRRNYGQTIGSAIFASTSDWTQWSHRPLPHCLFLFPLILNMQAFLVCPLLLLTLRVLGKGSLPWA